MDKKTFLNLYSKKHIYKKDDFSILTFWKVVRHKDGDSSVFYLDGYNKICSAYLQGDYIEDELEQFETGDQFNAKFDPFGGMVHATKLASQTSMIKRYREYAGISRAQMSRDFEIPIRTLEDWESGKNKCPKYTERLIIDKLKQYQPRPS